MNLDSTLNLVEKYFQCSGICYSQDFYFFTNISMGYPSSNCVNAIESYVNSKANLFAAGCFVIGTFLMLGVIGSIIIICCIGHKNKIKAVSQYKYEIMEENII